MIPSETLRVSPLSIIYFCISNIYKAINLWPVFAGIVAIPTTRAWLFELGLVGVLLIILAASVINYCFFTFHFDEEKIQIQSGLIFRKKLTLYFERVQEANLEQAVYFRPFDLWVLKFESAGSKEDIALPGIPQNLASELKQRVLDAHRKATQNEMSVVENLPDEPVKSSVDYEIKLRITDLVRYGLMHNTLIYYLAILGSLLGQNEKFWQSLSLWVAESYLAQEIFAYLSIHSVAVNILLVIFLTGLLLALIYLLSTLMALVKYWGYHLTVEGDRFQYHAGLLTKHASGFRQHKLQTLVVKQSLMARLLKRYSIEVKQTNETKIKQGDLHSGFIIPVATKQQLDHVLGLLNLEMPDLQLSMPAKIMWDSILFGCLFLTMLSLLLFSIGFSFWLLIPAFIFIVLLNIKNWYSIGYALGDQGFVVRRGILGIKTTYLPYAKVQKIQLAQGPFQRIHKAGKVVIWSGATQESLNFIPLDKLQKQSAELIQKVANYRGRWM